MDAALAALDRGVRALFTADSLPASSHPLCECSILQPPPPDWRYLRRFPVLARHVLTQWRVVAAEPRAERPTPRKKRQKRVLTQQIQSDEAYRTHALAALCCMLAQCGLVTVRDVELLQSLVASADLKELQNVVTGRLLPLRLRAVVLGFALQSQEMKLEETAVQSWVQEVCEKVVEEALEAMAQSGSKSLESQAVRQKSGEVDGEKCCVFCREGVSAEPLRSRMGGWDFLVECAQRCAQMLEGGGESDFAKKTVAALMAFRDAIMTTTSLTKLKTGRRRKRSEMLVRIANEDSPALSIPAYEQICRKITESLACLPDSSVELRQKHVAVQRVWMRVWKREFSRFAEVKQVTLVAVIRHCSEVDVFASMMVSTEMNVKTSQLSGLRVVAEVIRSLFVDVPGIITAFARVWGTCGNGIRSKYIGQYIFTRGVEASPMKRILREYLNELLLRSNVWHQGEASITIALPTTKRTEAVDLLLFLFEIFAEPSSCSNQHSTCNRQWDILMTQYGGGSAIKESAQGGMNWCLALEKCVIGINDMALTALDQGSCFLLAFKIYCLIVMNGIIATDGEIISSGGTIRRQLMRIEDDRLAVRRVLTQAMTTFGHNWTCRLIANMLRSHTNLRGSKEVNQRGMKALLYPALVSSMKNSSRSTQMRRMTGRQQFVNIVGDVNAILKGSEPTPLYLLSLMRFCEAWDVYQCTHTKDPPSRINRWGYRAMVDLDVLPELIECYETGNAVCEETNEVLTFTAEVLQNASNCPPSLVEYLYRVLSAVREAVVGHNKCVAPYPPAAQLVSHSDEILNRLLRAVKSAELVRTRQLMKQIKDAVGTLIEFKQQLKQWFSSLDTRETTSIGKESRLELALLCSRLIQWFPDEFESLRLLMSPLDSHLVFALKAFVKDAGKPGGNAVGGFVLGSSVSSSLPPAVRIEMALHLYLSAVAFPDLESLTVLLIKAIVKCRSHEAFEHLSKVAHKNAQLLLPEVALAALKSPLSGLEFSVLSAAYKDDEDDGSTEFEQHSRRAKSIIYQQNALKVLATSASIFDGRLVWSAALFDEESVVTWLPFLFEYLMKTEFCEGILRTNVLLTSLEKLTHSQVSKSKKVLQEAFWVAALLNTALVACSGRHTREFLRSEDKIFDRLVAITGKVLYLLSTPVDRGNATPKASDDNVSTTHRTNSMLALFNRSKCTRVSIEENGIYRSSEHILDKRSAGALQKSLPEVWEPSQEASEENMVESAIQLFACFSLWLKGALVYSQSFLEEPSAIMRHWERTFISYVTDVYLHLEFENDTCSLLKTWMSTWISCNIIRGKYDKPLLALLPSQVALFRRLGMTPYRGPSSLGKIQDSTSIWKLVFLGVNLALDRYTAGNETEFDQTTELIVSTMSTLELVDLSAATDFMRCSHVHAIEPIFEELEKVLTRPQLRACSTAQAFCLLQYPLEVLVCCYACKFRAGFEAESLLFLQRMENVIRNNIIVGSVDEKPLGDVKGTESTVSLCGEENSSATMNSPSAKFVVDATELNAFYKYWSDEMLLKYDYLDRERCAKVLKTILDAMLGVKSSSSNTVLL